MLRSGEAAIDFWWKHTANVTPPPAPPWVDFENEMVIVALLGTQSSGGGPDIRIVSVQEHDCYLLVTVRMDYTPGPLTVVTNPYAWSPCPAP